MTHYAKRITELAPGVNPGWIEAWMRLERGTLDSLTAAQFKREVRMAVACIEASSPADNEALAKSYGL